MKLFFILSSFLILCILHINISTIDAKLYTTSIHQTQTTDCETPSCKKCKSFCPSLDQLNSIKERCETLSVIANKRQHFAHEQCLGPDCYPMLIKQACGIIDIDPSTDPLEQIKEAIRLAKQEIEEISQYERPHILEPGSPEYQYDRQLGRVLVSIVYKVKSTLELRKRYIELFDYFHSSSYRKIQQEATRVQFEFQDLYRHLEYWKKERQNLALAVKTSPEELKAARDRLRKSLITYLNDADLLTLLQNTSLTKEQKAQLILAIKEEVTAQLEAVQDNLEHVIEEEQFIKEARREIFNLLNSILNRVNRKQLEIGCGGNELSSLVTNAINLSS